jgi:hypothetical protein
MPKWKKNTTEFSVSVNFVEGRGYASSIPKPVMEVLGEPKNLAFVVKGKRVEVHAADKESD